VHHPGVVPGLVDRDVVLLLEDDDVLPSEPGVQCDLTRGMPLSEDRRYRDPCRVRALDGARETWTR